MDGKSEVYVMSVGQQFPSKVKSSAQPLLTPS